MNNFYLCFIPLLVAVDAIGVLPLFLGITEGYSRRAIYRIIIESVITATSVGLLFLIVGRVILNLVGVTIPDFMAAGGMLLFVISIKEVVGERETYKQPETLETMGAVPLGVPLITGPAVLTTLILLQDRYGLIPATTAFIANMALAGLCLRFSTKLYTFLGKAGTRTVSKIAAILLGAVGVMMVRKGLMLFLANPNVN